MKKIDIHCHVNAFPEFSSTAPNGKRMLSAEEQLDVFDEFNIEHGVILPLVSPEAQWVPLSNNDAQYIVAKYPERFSWFCNVDPRQGGYSEKTDLSHIIGQYKEKGAKGLGELTATLYADDPMMQNLFGACAELDMPVIIHISPKPGKGYGIIDDLGLPRIEKMLKKFPDLKLIGHSTCFWSELSGDVTDETRGSYFEKGTIKEGRVAKLMREYGNLYCDISAGSGSRAMMSDAEYTAKFIEEFSDRIFFGTDVTSPGKVYPQNLDNFLINLCDNGMISRENYEKIIRKNAEKLLGL